MELPNSVVQDPPIPDNIVPLWEEFFSRPQTTTGNLWPALFSSDLFPLQRGLELGRLLKLAKDFKPKTIMDIGSDKGSTLFHFLTGFKPRNAIACEIRGTPYDKLFERQLSDPKRGIEQGEGRYEFRGSTRFLWLQESSLNDQAFEKVKRFLASTTESGKIDFLFIDGDKSYFDVDFDLYRPLVSDTGLICMHDITDPKPGESYRKIRERGYRTFDILDTTEAQEMLYREPRNSYEAWLKHWTGRSCGVGCIFMEGGPR